MLTKYSSLECCLIWKFIHSFFQQMPGTVLGTEDVLGNKTDLVSVLMELTSQWKRQAINCKETNQYVTKIIPVCNQCCEGNKQG